MPGICSQPRRIYLQTDDRLKLKINCYPNPTSEQFFIALEEPMDQLVVFNSQGQLMTQRENLEKGEMDIKVSNWPSGVYYLELRKEIVTVCEKLVVE